MQWWKWWVTLGALSVHSCFGKTSGDLVASKVGDISEPATRARPDTRIVEECGGGDLTDAGLLAIARLPYLQQVSPESAWLLLTTRENAAPIIDVTTPAGEPVQSVTAIVDETAPLNQKTQWVARLNGLSENTLYCYEVRGLSSRTGFVTAPAKTNSRPVRFVVFGDSGTGDADQYEVMRQMQTVPFDFLLHTGDVAYSDGRLSEFERNHFAVYAPVLAKFSFFPTAGNHDYRTSGGAPYRQVFALPENGGPSGLERYYSFDWGQVHFVALDTEVMGAQQTAWLDADLSKNELPWTVVYSHVPPFSSGEHGDNSTFKRLFVPILEKHRVALVLSGHEHNYERFKPIDGIHYVVTGGGGRYTRAVGTGSQTAFSESVLHFVYVEIDGSRLSLHAIDGMGSEFDSLRVDRPAAL